MNDFIYVDLKSLSENELREIVNIDSAIPTEFDKTWKPDEEYRVKRLKFFQDLTENDFFKAVIDKKKIIAFYCIRVTKFASTNIGMATTIWVHQDHRKEGIAKKLYDMGIEWAKLNKVDYLQSSVHSNNDRSMELHLKSGFETYAVTLRLKI